VKVHLEVVPFWLGSGMGERLRVSGFGIRDSRFWILVSGFGIRDSGFGIRDSGFSILVSGVGFRGEGVRTGIFVLRFEVQESGLSIQGAGFGGGYRGTSLIRNRLLLGPYSRTMSRVMQWT